MAKSIKNYEKKYTALEEVVKKLDDESLSMHELLKTYKEGLTLVKECSDLLQLVEEEIEQIIETVQVGDKVRFFRYNRIRIFIQKLLSFKELRILC